MNSEKNAHLGKKILYSLVIGMSGLIMLFGLIGIMGVWVVQRPISDAAVATLKVVEGSAVAFRNSTERIDQPLETLAARTHEIVDASQQLSQNVTDKGLAMVLLPPEKEQQLSETAGSVRDTYATIRETVTNGLELYRSINRIPFVNLPGLSDEQMESVENSITQTQSTADALRTQVADVRSGVAGAIGKVESAANRLIGEIQNARKTLAEINTKMTALEERSQQLQRVIPRLLVTTALVLSLILAFLIFTQVEVIRVYIERWRELTRDEQNILVEPLLQTDISEEGKPLL